MDMEAFQYVSYAQEVIFGGGSLAKLGEAVKGFGWQRLMLVANPSMRSGGHVAALQTVLGDCLVAVFDRVQPHVQDVQVEEVIAQAVEKEVDVFIGMGGGSPVGMAKAASLALEEALRGRSEHAGQTPRAGKPTGQPLVPVIAIPTTYAGSEMTPIVGITHSRETPPRKVTVSDPKIAPRLVLYDPRLTLDLPPEMTASTGMNALAHCIEALYSITRHPLSTAAATSGVQHIARALPICYERGNDLVARTEMLLGAHLAGASLSSVALGLHHGLCHVLGGTAGVPHGIANAIILPHAVRFNASATADLLLPAAQAMGVAGNASSPVAAVEALADAIYALVGRMNLPQHLRDVGVKEEDLPRLAQLGFQNRTVQNNPRPVTGAAQIEKLLREAW